MQHAFLVMMFIHFLAARLIFGDRLVPGSKLVFLQRSNGKRTLTGNGPNFVTRLLRIWRLMLAL